MTRVSFRPVRIFASLLGMVLVAGSARAQDRAGSLVWVQGGPFINIKSNYYGKRLVNPYIGRPVTVDSFYIGRYEVTQKEWMEVMGGNPSQFRGDILPVEMVSWYDCVEYCNKRSIAEGLRPYYTIDKKNRDPGNQTVIDDIRWTVTRNPGANGYRLPTEAEWEYAAGGGQMSKGYTYSGGDDADKVAWYFKNSGDKELPGEWNLPMIKQNHDRSRPVGGKQANELGLYDMSGNVREWCWDWYGDLRNDGSAVERSSRESGRVWRGGGWLGSDFSCASSFRTGFEANGRGPDQGLRVCRDGNRGG